MTLRTPSSRVNGVSNHNAFSYSPPAGPGKTAPRLIYDALLLEAPIPEGRFDILAQAPPLFDTTLPPPKLRSDHACNHDYALDYSRCSLPPRDYRGAAGDRFNVEAVCRRCRTHIHVDLSYSSTGQRPCPNSDYPLHHFVFSGFAHPAAYAFTCSSADCGTVVTITYQSAVISHSDLELLTDTNLLRRRYDAAVETNSDRQGFVLATPVATLWKLRRYVRDSLTSNTSGRKIPMMNKRYLESFGDDTAEVFQRLGFTIVVEDDEDFWALPQVPEDAFSGHRAFLQNWDMELQALIEQFAARDGDLNPCPEYIWLPARNEIDRVLAAQNYTRSIQSRREDSATAQDHPYYASLGAMRDFADDLIIYAFDRQIMCDPPNLPYYFDCLQDLAAGRESESLQLKASLLESEGVTGQKAVTQAYRYFGLEANSKLSDDQIINVYRVRLEDTSPSNHHEVRTMLRRLGTARQSQALTDAASNTIDTYQQALSWLGAEANYPDDSILTLHTTKVADNPDNARLARRAVEVIADHRKSDPLHSWLTTGEMRDAGMSVDDACKHLNIKLDTVDDTTLQLVFDGAKRDNPGWRTDQAISVVTRAYQKPQSGPVHDPSEWPVGLTSHGNTCYLNSLLQYYFTIKPLRDLVLNFDEFKFNVSQDGGKLQRVGARKVTAFEIRAYQKFVDDLNHLFVRMIRDRGPAVKPEADLVCRAFLKAEDTEGQIAPLSRTHSPPPNQDQADINEPRPVVQPSTTESTQRAPSGASSATLAGSDVVMPEAMNTSQILPDTPPKTPPREDEQANNVETLSVPALPPRPVSTPVRQQTNLAKAEEAARQQQDVTEVMDEILFRLRCAIKPDGQDKREEQLDAFRNIFYMRISEKTLGENDTISSREEYAMNILLNIPSRPTDIYSALDEVFELQTIEHGDKKLRQYKTIQECPPILQVNIPRITYDRATGRGVKVEHKVHLEETIFLDRYFEWEDPSVLKRRQDTWGWRQQLEVLQAQRDVINRDPVGLDGPTKLKTVAKYLRNLQSCNEKLAEIDLPPFEIEESTVSNLEAVAEAQQTQLSMISEQITALQTRIATSFSGLEQLKYRLAAVFFHRGGYGHGHYWTCIYDFANSLWRIYNDEKVEKFDKLIDIFDAETWQQGTPTYAVYVRDEIKEAYIQPVCRDVEEAAVDSVEVGDQVMQDAPFTEAPPPPPVPARDAPVPEREGRQLSGVEAGEDAKPIREEIDGVHW